MCVPEPPGTTSLPSESRDRDGLRRRGAPSPLREGDDVPAGLHAPRDTGTPSRREDTPRHEPQTSSGEAPSSTPRYEQKPSADGAPFLAGGAPPSPWNTELRGGAGTQTSAGLSAPRDVGTSTSRDSLPPAGLCAPRETGASPSRSSRHGSESDTGGHPGDGYWDGRDDGATPVMAVDAQRGRVSSQARSRSRSVSVALPTITELPEASPTTSTPPGPLSEPRGQGPPPRACSLPRGIPAGGRSVSLGPCEQPRSPCKSPAPEVPEIREVGLPAPPQNPDVARPVVFTEQARVQANLDRLLGTDRTSKTGPPSRPPSRSTEGSARRQNTREPSQQAQQQSPQAEPMIGPGDFFHKGTKLPATAVPTGIRVEYVPPVAAVAKAVPKSKPPVLQEDPTDAPEGPLTTPGGATFSKAAGRAAPLRAEAAAKAAAAGPSTPGSGAATRPGRTGDGTADPPPLVAPAEAPPVPAPAAAPAPAPAVPKVAQPPAAATVAGPPPLTSVSGAATGPQQEAGEGAQKGPGPKCGHKWDVESCRDCQRYWPVPAASAKATPVAKPRRDASVGPDAAWHRERRDEGTVQADVGTDAPRRISEEDRWIPRSATSDAPWCPKCWGTMVYRSARHGGHFWGCSQYPTCDATRRPHECASMLTAAAAVQGWTRRTWEPDDDGDAASSTRDATAAAGTPDPETEDAAQADNPWATLV